jgi:hypothetical protein
MIDLEVSVSASGRPAGHANHVANGEPIARQPSAALRAYRAPLENFTPFLSVLVTSNRMCGFFHETLETTPSTSVTTARLNSDIE